MARMERRAEHFCWLRGHGENWRFRSLPAPSGSQPVNPLTPRSWRFASSTRSNNTSFTRRVPVAKAYLQASVGRCQGPPYPAIPPASEQLGVLFVPSPPIRGSESAVLLSFSLPPSPRLAELDTLGSPRQKRTAATHPKPLYTLYVPAIPAEELGSPPPARSSPHPHVARHFLTSTTTLARATKLETPPSANLPSQPW